MAVRARLDAAGDLAEEAGSGRRPTNRDWLLWAIECAEIFGRQWRAQPQRAPRFAQHVPSLNAATCDLSPMAVAASVAREFAGRKIDEWGMATLSEPVGLVVSELVTNALLHAPSRPHRVSAGRRIQLSLAGEERHAMCAVTDPGGTGPVRRRPSPVDETGRGLQLVDYFSAAWGWLPRSTEGKVVWALFALPE